MRKIGRVNSKQKELQFFKQLKDTLDPVMKDPLEQKFLLYFDVVSWLESKIEKRSLEDVVRGKLIS